MRHCVFLVASSLALAALAAPAARTQNPTHIAPAAAATDPGNINNLIPFRQSSIHYQQVHSAGAWSNTTTTLAQRLRFRAKAATTGGSLDIEIYFAQSPNSAFNASSTFLDNTAPGTEVNVFTRKVVNLPDIPVGNWGAGDFTFDNPFLLLPTQHVSWRMVIHSNNTAAYTLDAFSDWRFGTSSGYTGCAHPLGTRNASQNSTYRSPGNRWNLNGYTWVANMPMPAVCTIGVSPTNWAGVPLPLDLTPFGAPGCEIVNDILVALPLVSGTAASGWTPVEILSPPDQNLIGGTIYTQFLFFDTGANALGVFTSNGQVNANIPAPHGTARIYAIGNPGATGGTSEIEFAVPIGVN